MEAAEGMLIGSMFAGIAFSFARLGNVHAMSHPVSAYYNVPHGVANAVLLPVVMEYNALADHGRYRKIYNYISDIVSDDGEFRPQMFPYAVRRLCGEIGIPADMMTAIRQSAGSGIERSDVEKKISAMAEDAMKSGNITVNPRTSRQCDIEELYRRAL